MKCLGLIGGIGWESTALYYRHLNENMRRRFGSLHSARLLVNSLSFDPLDTLVRTNRWNEAGAMLADAAQRLERAGADPLPGEEPLPGIDAELDALSTMTFTKPPQAVATGGDKGHD